MLTNIWIVIKLLWKYGRTYLPIIVKLGTIVEVLRSNGFDREMIKRVVDEALAAVKGEAVTPISAGEENTEKGRLLKRLFNRLGIQFACASDPDYAEFTAWKALYKLEREANA